MNAEQLARTFHETYERLAPSFGYETRRQSAVPWEQVPENNKALMVAVATEILDAEPADTPCPSCNGTGQEFSGVEYMGQSEVVGCVDCEGTGKVPADNSRKQPEPLTAGGDFKVADNAEAYEQVGWHCDDAEEGNHTTLKLSKPICDKCEPIYRKATR